MRKWIREGKSKIVGPSQDSTRRVTFMWRFSIHSSNRPVCTGARAAGALEQGDKEPYACVCGTAEVKK